MCSVQSAVRPLPEGLTISLIRNIYNGITSLFLAGYALHVCVESMLRVPHDLGYEVTVLEDARAAFNHSQRRHVLEEVGHHSCARTTVSAFLSTEMLKEGSARVSR